jgi:CheY-like chemotaxis protein
MARLVVLEPDADVRELLLHYLRQLGHEPIDPAADEPPDAVIVEPGDPAALRAARAVLADAPETRVVCVSVYPRSVAATALEAASAYLTKPVRLPDLRTALDGLD